MHSLGERFVRIGLNNRRLIHTARILSVTMLAAMATVLAGCGAENPGQASGGKARKKRVALVRVATVHRRDVAPRVVVVGSVTPRHTTVAASGANGLVESCLFEEGQAVKLNDVLSVLRMRSADLGLDEARSVLRRRKAQLDELKTGSRPEDIAQAKANMLGAKSTRKYTTDKLVRLKRLFANNATNRDQLDDAEQKAQAAVQAFLAAEAVYRRVFTGPRPEEIARAQADYQAQLDQVQFLEAEKAKRTTRAPFTGYVARQHTYIGQWLSKGDPVATLVNLELVDIVVNVDQSDLRHVQSGKSVAFRVPGTDKLNWTGTIVAIVPRSQWQTGSRGFPVKIRLQNQFTVVNNKRLPVLKEGMMAEVTFRGQPVDAIMVPKDSLVRTSRGTMIVLYRPSKTEPNSGTVLPIVVETGISERTAIQVTGSGIADGMQVVIEGAERLRPSQTVRLAPSDARTGQKPKSDVQPSK